jgi:dTMP kinase
VSGVFVTFEGIEGCGKSTQLALLAAALQERGSQVTVTREPGGTSAGDAIRRLLLDASGPDLDPLAELFLYLADRTQHVRETVKPALAMGRIVLCDRFSDSTIAYQGYGRGGDVARIRHLDEIARDGCRPDLTFLLDCPVAVGLERARIRATTPAGGDRFELEPEVFHERVRAGFLKLAAAEPDRIRIIDSRLSLRENGARILDETLRRLAAAQATR